MKYFVFHLLFIGLLSQTVNASVGLHVALGPEGAGRIYVPAAFNFHSDHCLLDTGARITVVDDIFSYRELPVVGQENGTGVGGGKLIADLVAVDRIILGSQRFYKRIIRRQSPAPADCVIGNDLVKERPYRLDFDDKRIIFEPDSAITPFPLFTYRGLWHGFDVSIGQTSFLALFDTGAARTVVDSSVIENAPDKFTFLRDTKAQDSTGREFKIKMYTLDKITIAGQEVTETIVYAMDLSHLRKDAPGVQILLGFNHIWPFNWTVDPIQGKFGVSKRPVVGSSKLP